MSKTIDTPTNPFSAGDGEHETSGAEKAIVEQDGALQGKTSFSRLRTLETSVGTLFLRDFCSPQLVESLQADSGLNAFTRLPEREHQLLLTIAKRSDNVLTLAYTLQEKLSGRSHWLLWTPGGQTWSMPTR